MYSLIDPAALKIAVDTVDDGLIEKDHAVKNLVEPGHLEQLFHPQFASDVDYEQDVMGEGLPASPGAAVVARGWGKPCVAGCDDIVVNDDRKSFTNGEVTVEEGDWISINGSTGEVVGKQPLVAPNWASSLNAS